MLQQGILLGLLVVSDAQTVEVFYVGLQSHEAVRQKEKREKREIINRFKLQMINCF